MVTQNDPKVQEEHHLVSSMYQMAKEIERIRRDPEAILEYVANTTMGAAAEYTLLVDEILEHTFGFSPKKIDEFHECLRDGLVALRDVHTNNAHPMTPKDMAVVGEIAKLKAPQERMILMEKKLGIAPREELSKLLKS